MCVRSMNYSLSLVVNGHEILYMYSSHFYLCLSIIFLCDSILNVCLISHGAIKKCRYFLAQVEYWVFEIVHVHYVPFTYLRFCTLSYDIVRLCWLATILRWAALKRFTSSSVDIHNFWLPWRMIVEAECMLWFDWAVPVNFFIAAYMYFYVS